MKNSMTKWFHAHVPAAVLCIAAAVGVAVSGSVAAAPSTNITWKVSSLAAGQIVNLSSVVSTNSTGVKTWSKTGLCTLTPTRKPTKLTMGVSGSCALTLKIAKSKTYPAKTSTKKISPVELTTTTTPTTTITTTVAPTTTTTTVASTTTTTSTTVVNTCAVGGLCAVDNTGPGGGKVFYVASSVFTSIGSACGTACKYLEAAPAGWITASTPAGQTYCQTPGTSSVDPSCEWSGNTSALIGSTGTGFGAGFANTSAIINQNNTAGKAATVARAFQGGGKTDWFLPSKDELNALCKWAFNDTVNTICNSGTPRLSLTNGSFSEDYYWSSSEDVAFGASTQFFYYGFQPNTNKTSTLRVRPVRAF